MECINESCSKSKKGQCENKKVIDLNYCSARIKPAHTPNYAEEQLNHAIEKEFICYNKNCGDNERNHCTVPHEDFSCTGRIKKPINYEAEYNNLKEKLEVSQTSLKLVKKHVETYEKEYDKLKEENEKLRNEISEVMNRITYKNVSKLKEENEGLRDKLNFRYEENLQLKDKIEKINQEFQEEIRNLNNQLEKVEFENKELITRNEKQKSSIGSMLEEIEMLKQMYANKEIEVNKLKEDNSNKPHSDLKTENENLRKILKALAYFL